MIQTRSKQRETDDTVTAISDNSMLIQTITILIMTRIAMVIISRNGNANILHAMSFGARAHAPTRARARAHTPTRTRGRARLPFDRLWLRNRQLEGIYFRTFLRTSFG